MPFNDRRKKSFVRIPWLCLCCLFGRQGKVLFRPPADGHVWITPHYTLLQRRVSMPGRQTVLFAVLTINVWLMFCSLSRSAFTKFAWPRYAATASAVGCLGSCAGDLGSSGLETAVLVESPQQDWHFLSFALFFSWLAEKLPFDSSCSQTEHRIRGSGCVIFFRAIPFQARPRPQPGSQRQELGPIGSPLVVARASKKLKPSEAEVSTWTAWQPTVYTTLTMSTIMNH